MAEETIETEIDLNKVGNEGQDNKPQNIVRQNVRQDDNDDIDVKIVDDTPPQDRNRPKPGANVKSAIPSDDEIGNYSKGVQERLKQMKWEYHEERRAKEAAYREHEAAMAFAQRALEENQRLRKTLEEGHKTMLGANKSAVESELAALQGNLKAAVEAGDAENIAKYNAAIAKAAARLVNVENTQPIKFDEPPQGQQNPQGQQGQPQWAPQQVKLTNAMQDWMSENPWFNNDKRMTAYAFGVHDELKAKGVPLESPAYFKAINDEVRRVFPEYFGTDNDNGNGTQQGQSQRRTPAVGSASRLNGSGGNNEPRQKTQVSLTQSELAVAKRLGVSPKQYAAEKLRLENSRNG